MSLSEQQITELRKYMATDTEDLLAELADLAPTAGTRGINPLAAYREALRKVICLDFNWPQKRQRGEFNDPLNLAMAVCDVLIASGLGLPFPITLTSSVIVKTGLDVLCAGCGPAT